MLHRLCDKDLSVIQVALSLEGLYEMINVPYFPDTWQGFPRSRLSCCLASYII